MLSKFVVAAPLFAVAVLALFMAWGHSFAGSAQAANAVTGQMDLSVKAGGVACPPASLAEFCAVKNTTFTLSVEITKSSAAPGYIGVQTEIDYNALVYKPTTPAAPEITWPCVAFCLRSPGAPSGLEGLVNHAGATGSTPPFPPSMYVGNATDIILNCTSGNSAGNIIDLVPLGPGNTNGSGLKPSVGADIPLSDSTTVDCVQAPPTPTTPPTATPPDFPQMQKLCADKGAPNASTGSAQCNLFLTRQGSKIPPLTCGGGNNAATFQERLSIPIPVLPDPKDPSLSQQLGAFEFEVHFDDTKVCVNIVPGAAAANMLCVVEDKDSSSLEGVARIGCVTLGKTGFPDTTTKAGKHLADVVVRPQPDVYSQAKPNQDNGVGVQINNVLCELADLQGHPIPVFSCEDADLTIRYLEGDVAPDCSVNALDTQAIAFRWGVEKGSLIYVEFMNLEPSGPQADDDIDIKDLQFVFGRFGSTCKVPHPDQDPVNLKA
jgi:hypothetical protein